MERIFIFYRPSVPSSPGSLKRFYFEHLQLNSTQLKLSVSSTSRLPEDLQSLKSSLGLIIVNLEDATVDLGVWKIFGLDIQKIRLTVHRSKLASRIRNETSISSRDSKAGVSSANAVDSL